MHHSALRKAAMQECKPASSVLCAREREGKGEKITSGGGGERLWEKIGLKLWESKSTFYLIDISLFFKILFQFVFDFQ